MSDLTVTEIDLASLGALPPSRAQWVEIGAASSLEMPGASYLDGPVDDLIRERFRGNLAQLPPYGCAIFQDSLAYGDGLAIIDDRLFLNPSITAGPSDIGAWGFFNKISPATNGVRLISDLEVLPSRLKKAILLSRRSDFVYGHWLLETLPRIRLAREICGEDVTFIVSNRILDYQISQLEELGISSEALFRLTAGEAVHCETLIVPSLAHWASDIVQPFAFETYDLLVEKFRAGALQGMKNILVTRNSRKHDPRPLLNIDEVEAILTRHGFAVIDPGAMNWREQIAVFSQARNIVGLAGSNLHNTVYTGSDAHILTLQPSQSRNFLQTAIAGVRKHKISYLFGESFSTKGDQSPDVPYAVDLELFQQALRECFPALIQG